jgi:hypothetical protein
MITQLTELQLSIVEEMKNIAYKKKHLYGEINGDLASRYYPRIFNKAVENLNTLASIEEGDAVAISIYFSNNPYDPCENDVPAYLDY